MALKLLIAEDARDVADVVAFGARMTWPDCDVVMASSGPEALDRFTAESPDLVVLDVSIPPPDGFEVCRRIRKISQVPIMMLTVRDTPLDKVHALDLGADDYLTKPFDHSELLARMRALVRRSNPTVAALPGHEVIAAGALTLDCATREVRIHDKQVPLTSTEFRLLEVLVRHAGNTLPHRLLLERVWGEEYVGDTHYLKVFVRRLRRKLGDDSACASCIQTEWGIGYRLVPAT